MGSDAATDGLQMYDPRFVISRRPLPKYVTGIGGRETREKKEEGKEGKKERGSLSLNTRSLWSYQNISLLGPTSKLTD